MTATSEDITVPVERDISNDTALFEIVAAAIRERLVSQASSIAVRD